MDTSQPIQHTSPDAAWVTTQIVEAIADELSKISLVDAATIIRSAIKGQPIDVAPMARLAVLVLLNLGLVVYDYLAPPSNPPPPPGKRSPIS
jgi:capsular polysaccharide biosynthesis protein